MKCTFLGQFLSIVALQTTISANKSPPRTHGRDRRATVRVQNNPSLFIIIHVGCYYLSAGSEGCGPDKGVRPESQNDVKAKNLLFFVLFERTEPPF